MANTNGLPKQLSAEEEEFYIQALIKGDHQAKNILIERNLRLVIYIANKYWMNALDNPYFSEEDIVSEGTIGLMKGINNYNPDKGTKLASYIARCIENEILMLLRKYGYFSTSIDEGVYIDKDGNDLTLGDLLPEEGSFVEDLEDYELRKGLQDSLKLLKDKEKIVIQMYFYENKLDHEIAKALKISRSYVSRIRTKALGRIEEELKARGLDLPKSIYFNERQQFFSISNKERALYIVKMIDDGYSLPKILEILDITTKVIKNYIVKLEEINVDIYQAMIELIDAYETKQKEIEEKKKDEFKRYTAAQINYTSFRKSRDFYFDDSLMVKSNEIDDTYLNNEEEEKRVLAKAENIRFIKTAAEIFPDIELPRLMEYLARLDNQEEKEFITMALGLEPNTKAMTYKQIAEYRGKNEDLKIIKAYVINAIKKVLKIIKQEEKLANMKLGKTAEELFPDIGYHNLIESISKFEDKDDRSLITWALGLEPTLSPLTFQQIAKLRGEDEDVETIKIKTLLAIRKLKNIIKEENQKAKEKYNRNITDLFPEIEIKRLLEGLESLGEKEKELFSLALGLNPDSEALDLYKIVELRGKNEDIKIIRAKIVKIIRKLRKILKIEDKLANLKLEKTPLELFPNIEQEKLTEYVNKLEDTAEAQLLIWSLGLGLEKEALTYQKIAKLRNENEDVETIKINVQFAIKSLKNTIKIENKKAKVKLNKDVTDLFPGIETERLLESANSLEEEEKNLILMALGLNSDYEALDFYKIAELRGKDEDVKDIRTLVINALRKLRSILKLEEKLANAKLEKKILDLFPDIEYEKLMECVYRLEEVSEIDLVIWALGLEPECEALTFQNISELRGEGEDIGTIRILVHIALKNLRKIIKADQKEIDNLFEIFPDVDPDKIVRFLMKMNQYQFKLITLRFGGMPGTKPMRIVEIAKELGEEEKKIKRDLTLAIKKLKQMVNPDPTVTIYSLEEYEEQYKLKKTL